MRHIIMITLVVLGCGSEPKFGEGAPAAKAPKAGDKREKVAAPRKAVASESASSKPEATKPKPASAKPQPVGAEAVSSTADDREDGSAAKVKAPEEAPPPPAAPRDLRLTHVPNQRTFSVSWSAGSGNGGANGCKLQYLKDGNTWTDLAGAYDCDASAVDKAAALPELKQWTAEFDATGIEIRLVRAKDSENLGAFGSRATCVPKESAAKTTPDIDENCNGIWDEISKSASCEAPITSSLAMGSAYSCAATVTCAGTTATFSHALFMEPSIDIFWYSGTDSNCETSPQTYAANAISANVTGTVPDRGIYKESLTATACQNDYPGWTYRASKAFSQFSTGSCFYTYGNAFD